ncbi:MAG: YbaN family protein [Candidatus Izemoplasmatales bacterium]
MKILYLSLGMISVGLGVAGVILPVLPTTPFLLLATLLFSKSSTKLDERFKNTKLYQRYLEDFIEKRTMTKRRKWTILIFADIFLFISFLLTASIYLRIIIVILFVTKHWYFYRFVKTNN